MNYEKKLVKHYANLCELTKKATQNDAFKYNLITAFCLYFKNAKKPAFNAEKLIEESKDLLLIENFPLKTKEDFWNANCALYALVNYKKATGETQFDCLLKNLFEHILEGANRVLNNKNGELLYYALASLNGLTAYAKSQKEEECKRFYELCKHAFENINPIADNAPCDLILTFALGAFEWEKDLSFVVCEKVFELVSLNALSIHFSIGKSLLMPQVSSPSATALALKLCVLMYRSTGKDLYLFMLRRIWFNGMQFCQRPNGGVGYDTFPLSGQTLAVLNYEQDELSPIYAEGLSLYAKHQELFCEKDGEVVRDSFGRYFIDDKMFARDESGFFGKDLIEIPSLTSFDKETALQLKLKLNF